MAGIQRFEEIEAWVAARKMTIKVYELTRRAEFRRDFALVDQIRRAAISVMSNIAEGFERGTDREFHRFPSIAKGSVGEVRSQIYIALDVGYITQESFDDLYALTIDVARLIGGFMRYLQPSEKLQDL